MAWLRKRKMRRSFGNLFRHYKYPEPPKEQEGEGTKAAVKIVSSVQGATERAKLQLKREMSPSQFVSKTKKKAFKQNI